MNRIVKSGILSDSILSILLILSECFVVCFRNQKLETRNFFYPLTTVPTFSPITTRLMACGWFMSNTMIGM